MNININKLHSLIETHEQKSYDNYNKLEDGDPVLKEEIAIQDTLELFKQWIEECKS